jgi:hypothetical protein
MSTRTILVTIVAIATLVIPTVAQGATIRVTSAKQPLLGNLEWDSGSTRSYVNDTGAALTLPANTALGQLVAATAFTSTALTIGEFAGLGPYVKTIGTERLGAKGAWDIYVNGKTPQVGAGSLVLRKSDQVIWFLDTDYSKKGPVVLDLQVKQLLGGILFTVRKADGKGLKPAKGATITLDGTAIGTTNAKGQLSFADSADWNEAHATMKGAIGSQMVIEDPLG